MKAVSSFFRWAVVVLFSVWLAVWKPAMAQTTKPKPQTTVAVPDDRAAVRVRYPAPEKIREFKEDRNYQYDHDAPPPENPIARFFSWFYQKFINFLNSEAYQNIWQYVVMACIAGFAVYLLMKAEVLGFLFPKKAERNSLDYESLAENIHEIDFDSAIADAVAQHNFRLAVRLLYLQTIKRLADAGRIVYKPEKTNRQYVYELATHIDPTAFENLTRQFEFVWYGDFPIDESRFATIQQQFRQFSAR
ncbi:DUF4129 domain-containing protein [Spirosoma sp. SC4-14]|uniref:DUF4129 domain-containing protein n=1 Tax=Spirosoma sp. SC4-14 TaxID=3128900 RepID=UPI0030CE4D04